MCIRSRRRVARRASSEQTSTMTDEHQRAGPRLPVPVVVRRDRVGEDLHRQRRDRLHEGGAEEPVVERGEEQRRRLPGDARERQHDARDDPGQRRRQHDASSTRAPRVAPSARAPSRSVSRHQPQQLFGRAGDDRNHHDAERDAAGERENCRNGSTTIP